MVIVRLAKSGAKKNPYYFITVADSRKPRDGAFIERLGFFNPSAKGSEERMRFNIERLDHWIAQGAQLSDKVKELAKDARLSPDELQEKLERKKEKRDKKKEAIKAKKVAELEAKAKEAEEALENLNELVDASINSETNSISAQASEVTAETDDSFSEGSSNAEYAYIKIGSYKRGNSANSLMNYIYDIMGFDTRFLKYDINIEKFDKNDFSVVIGPVPMTEAKSMLEELDTQLSSENSSIVDAELTCNEEVILMCSI